jgi:hypothetical protein
LHVITLAEREREREREEEREEQREIKAEEKKGRPFVWRVIGTARD